MYVRAASLLDKAAARVTLGGRAAGTGTGRGRGGSASEVVGRNASEVVGRGGRGTVGSGGRSSGSRRSVYIGGGGGSGIF